MKLCLPKKDLVARVRMAKTAETLLTEPRRPEGRTGASSSRPPSGEV